MIFVSVQIFDHPFPSHLHTHLKGAGIRISGPCPSASFECCALQNSGHGGHFGEPIQEGVLELQRDPKAAPPRPAQSIFLSNCHLPAMDLPDRRLRPAVHIYDHFHRKEYPKLYFVSIRRTKVL